MHAMVLAAFAAVYLAEELGAPVVDGWAPYAPWAAVGPVVIGLIGLWVYTASQMRGLDRDGRACRVRRVEALASALRWGLLGVHAAAAILCGTLTWVRSLIGDVIALDELLVLSVFVLGLCAIEFIVYPVQRRLRDAMIIRSLDSGLPVHPFPPRGRFVWLWARHHILFMLVPLTLLLAWAESIDRLVVRFDSSTLNRDAVLLVGQLLGLVGVFALIPPLLVRIWDTVPLREGELRDRLEALARAHGVRVRDFLVWRTSGLMLNGAAIGLVRPLRYVVLTDALLDRLDPLEVEAVAAHEIGHIRHHHTIWLAASVLASVLLFGTASGWMLMAFEPGSRAEKIGLGAAMGVTLTLTLVVLGMVSRRFERQADAFAARHLSGERRGGAAVEISPESAQAMAAALRRVAAAHDIIIDRPTFRHGSIARRIRSLAAAVGRKSDDLEADRSAGRARMWVAAMLAGGVILAGLDVALSFGGLGVVSS
ncbi:MAG: hypothetical protein D6695_01735 [Planctomycetota bacterium]|nr:MAG: hypothetical protein D6695_01735 [Planctomycetota bacterium]